MQIEDLAKVVDNLSKVVTEGFKEMREGFKEVHGGFKEMRGELNEVRGGLKELREDTDLILQTVNEHSGRLDRIENDLSEIKKTVVNLPTKVYVDDKISALRGDVVTIARDTALNAVGTK